MTGMIITGVGMLLVGASLIIRNLPRTEKQLVNEAYKELEFEKKKEKLMPMRNADINLFGLLRY